MPVQNIVHRDGVNGMPQICQDLVALRNATDSLPVFTLATDAWDSSNIRLRKILALAQ